jgi:hypothetical protein
MNWDHAAHVVRDVFGNRGFTIYYGEDPEFTETLRTSTHGIGAFLMHSNVEKRFHFDYERYWCIGTNMFFDADTCDFLISFDYDPVFHGSPFGIPPYIDRLMKREGLIFLVNPGRWAEYLGDMFILRKDLQAEVKRYSMFKNENVLVYEKV